MIKTVVDPLSGLKTINMMKGSVKQKPDFFKTHRFLLVAARVSGTDDYTGRFDFYVEHVAKQESIGVFETEHPITYVTAWDMAEFLQFLGIQTNFVGPINAGNSGYLSI